MEGKIRLAVFGQKRLSREGGIEIVVKELCTRMAQNGCEVTCYNRAGHHVSGAEYDKTIEYTISFYGVSVLWFLSALTIGLAFVLLIGQKSEKFYLLCGGGRLFHRSSLFKVGVAL